MSKKYLRKIVVGGEEFKWMVDGSDCGCDGDGGKTFKIWKDKKLIHENIIHNEVVTPKIVSEKIQQIINEKNK